MEAAMMRFFSIGLLLATISCFVVAGDVPTRDNLARTRMTHQIQAILDSISATNIHRYLDTLVSFQFRHTVDDTTSLTTGMGAARRWILSKFQEFSVASGGRLQPQYFDFDANICIGVSLHRNVMAILPGTVTPNRYFIVSGHMDTRGDPNNSCAHGIFSPGAVDDGSGTVISLELARVMSQYQFESSIIFMTVTGEDEGLFGSEAYAAFAENSGQRIDGMITNDVVGNIVGQNGIIDSTSVRHFSSQADATPHRQMSRYMKLTSEFFYPEMTVNLIPAVDRPGRGGDHQSFQNHGFTAVRFVEPNENFANQHTPTDLVENMSPAYTARVARVNAAGLASLLNAPEKPSTPTVFDPGNGTELIVQWTSTNTEPDLAGYRIAVRDSGGLFYNTIIDAGNMNADTIAGLTPGVSVYISISAYDTSGNESIFSTEVLAHPSDTPPPPGGVASTSFASNISLSWVPNPQTINVTKHRIYRSTSRTSGFSVYDSVLVPSVEYTDNAAAINTLYFYQVRAVDSDGSESGPSTTTPGQLVTHDLGVLVVDGTRDGSGSALAPTDAMVDSIYQTLVAGFTVGGEWDVADSVSDNIRISDAEMGRYSTVVWHTDVRGSEQVFRDTTAIRKYLQQGGRLVLGGWRLSGSLKLIANVGTSFFSPGSFVPTFLKVDSMVTSGAIQADFFQALSNAGSYPNILVDSIRIAFFNGTIPNMDVVLPPFADPSVSVLYSHHGKLMLPPFEGSPVAWRYLGTDAKVIVFDFPLYYMKTPEAGLALRQALVDLGETVGVEEDRETLPGVFALHRNYPNPFNPTTMITYDLPAASNVVLSIYDVLGREVRMLVDELKEAGVERVLWNGLNNKGVAVASGTYFYRMQASAAQGETTSFAAVKKMLLIR